MTVYRSRSSVPLIPRLTESGHVTSSGRSVLTSSLVGPLSPSVEVLTHMFTNRSRRIRFFRLDQLSSCPETSLVPLTGGLRPQGSEPPGVAGSGGAQRRRSHQVCHVLLLQRLPVISETSFHVKAPDAGGFVLSHLSLRGQLCFL